MSRITPNQKVLRRLTLAISKNDPHSVAKELESGVNPNIHCRTRISFPLNLAVRTWERAGKNEEERRKADEIINLLLDAGASPLAFDGTLTPIVGSSTRVCAHPRCLDIALKGARGWAQSLKERETTPLRDRVSAVSLLQLFKEDTPEHQEILEHLVDLGLHKITWWQAAMISRAPFLMEFILENQYRIPGGAPTADWVARFLREHLGGAMQDPFGVFAWLERLPSMEQAQALLGSPEKEGILAASIGQFSKVRDAVWKFALEHPETMDMMREQGRIPGYLALSMLGDAKISQIFLKKAVSWGVDVKTASVRDAYDLKPHIPAWEDGFIKRARPSKNASLLECHLRRPSSDVSAPLLRALVKAGVRPDYHALSALCSQITPLQTISRRVGMVRLAKEWTLTYGADPAPEGEIPVWEQIQGNQDEMASLREMLQAHHLESQMESFIPEALAKPKAPVPKARF